MCLFHLRSSWKHNSTRSKESWLCKQRLLKQMCNVVEYFLQEKQQAQAFPALNKTRFLLFQYTNFSYSSNRGLDKDLSIWCNSVVSGAEKIIHIQKKQYGIKYRTLGNPCIKYKKIRTVTFKSNRYALIKDRALDSSAQLAWVCVGKKFIQQS